jgi:hypothetical protein
MRKRVVRAVIFIALAVAAAVGGATAAGAFGSSPQVVHTTDGTEWQ